MVGTYNSRYDREKLLEIHTQVQLGRTAMDGFYFLNIDCDPPFFFFFFLLCLNMKYQKDIPQEAFGERYNNANNWASKPNARLTDKRILSVNPIDHQSNHKSIHG